jgi:threonine dehydrogenase-like Zn-dependent dehydrogenase
LVAARCSRVAEGPTPEPGWGEVLIEVKACGVCASELHDWMGGSSSYPRRLGHEPSGIVRAVGPRVTKFDTGQAVTGLLSSAYSQFEVANQDDLVAIPEGVSCEFALGEPLACLVNAQRRTHIELADQVAVIGLGFMGLGMLQLLRLRGPRRLIGIDVREEARQKALELGADEVHHPEQVPSKYLLTRGSEWQGHKGVDV